jgi:exoribonuclease-2
MNQGKIVEYIDQGDFVSALCLEDDGHRLHLLTLTNREVNLAAKRAVFISKGTVNTRKPRAELLSGLKQAEERRAQLEVMIEVKELWDLVREEGTSFDFEYLAQLCFGEHVTDDHVSALVRALFKDKVHFKMKEGRFLPNPEAKVEQILAQLEEEARKEEMLVQGGAWLKRVLAKQNAHDPPHKQEILDTLAEVALYGQDAPSFKFAKELLGRAGLSGMSEARNALVKLGIWEENENLDLLRLGISRSFSEEVLHESERITGIQVESAGREDLRHLPVFTIDGPFTRDFDDAISIEIEGEVIHLGIHIADVASLVPPDSILDKEAAQRGSSLYLPSLQIPMLPTTLSQDALSLREGHDRLAISLLARLDKGGHLMDFRFLPSLIRVKRQLTYDQANELYLREEWLGELHRLSRMLRQKRMEQGALLLSLPEIVIQVDDGSSISIEMLDQDTPSRMIVAELMIFYNWLTAQFCRDNGIPAVYRGQGEPGERLSVGDAGYHYYVFKQRRKLTPLVIDTEARPHASLGVDAYTTASSPIRRYFDVLVQRQVRNFLFNEGLEYDREELEDKRMALEPILKDLEKVKRNRIRYWVQKYLHQHTGETLRAIVLDSLTNRYRLLLSEFLMVVEMKRQSGQLFSEGQALTVRVKKSDPWNDVLLVEAVE